MEGLENPEEYAIRMVNRFQKDISFFGRIPFTAALVGFTSIPRSAEADLSAGKPLGRLGSSFEFFVRD